MSFHAWWGPPFGKSNIRGVPDFGSPRPVRVTTSEEFGKKKLEYIWNQRWKTKQWQYHQLERARERITPSDVKCKYIACHNHGTRSWGTIMCEVGAGFGWPYFHAPPFGKWKQPLHSRKHSWRLKSNNPSMYLLVISIIALPACDSASIIHVQVDNSPWRLVHNHVFSGISLLPSSSSACSR
jgi:hypothetical protein